MVTRIRKHSKAHLYIEEHMEAKGLNFDTLGGRLGVSRTTVWRWAKEQWRLDPLKMAQLADALGLDGPEEFYRYPTKRESLDRMLADAPDDVFEDVIDIARRLKKRAS